MGPLKRSPCTPGSEFMHLTQPAKPQQPCLGEAVLSDAIGSPMMTLIGKFPVAHSDWEAAPDDSGVQSIQWMLDS